MPPSRTVAPYSPARTPPASRRSGITGRHLGHFIPVTNLLEPSLGEVRRRTKVIGRFPGETSALSLIWAVLELSSRGWRGVIMTPKTVAEIERIRRQQNPSATTDTEEVTAA